MTNSTSWCFIQEALGFNLAIDLWYVLPFWVPPLALFTASFSGWNILPEITLKRHFFCFFFHFNNLYRIEFCENISHYDPKNNLCKFGERKKLSPTKMELRDGENAIVKVYYWLQHYYILLLKFLMFLVITVSLVKVFLAGFKLCLL